ncbi:MAG: phosphate acyltransferase PlsX [Deltaproteobacteria bacterium]|nr:MAG: phosphate acyltransferase PlsX [Deltaproteobacteria bacterium]
MTAPWIALDAFGGDTAPEPELDAVVMAVEEGVRVLVVGDETIVRPALTERFGGRLPDTVEIAHAEDAIRMDDAPAQAVRRKPDASMPVAFDLVREGRAAAVVSAGNSGAMLACGLFKFRRIRGIERPAICTRLPTRGGFLQLIDAGANVECKPLHLVQFAVLGAVYHAMETGIERPRVGVLANGTEASKGTDLTRRTHELLAAHAAPAFEYVGYVEGRFFDGTVDVVVTDGFTGNVALKVAEGAGALVAEVLRDEARSSLRVGLGALLMRPAFDEIRRISHPDFYGGAPLLGVRHLAIICHGSSSARTLATALVQAARLVDRELAPALSDAVERHRPLFDAARAPVAAQAVEERTP